MTLAAMQRDFRNWLVDAPVTMESWVDEEARAGLDIYHNAYRVQLVDCLRETFEMTVLWLGDDAFMAAARRHIETTPPHGWTLGVYGDGFDRTLDALYPEDLEVAELARLDWALSRAFEGEDARPVAAEMLVGVDWDNALLTFIPTMQIGQVTTNAGAIWSALSAQQQPPMPELLPASGAMLVWRQDYAPCFRTIDATEVLALALTGTGISFGGLCATFIERFGAEAGVAQAGALLGQWIGDGLITAITQEGLSSCA